MGDLVNPKGLDGELSRMFGEVDEELSDPKGWYPAPE